MRNLKTSVAALVAAMYCALAPTSVRAEQPQCKDILDEVRIGENFHDTSMTIFDRTDTVRDNVSIIYVDYNLEDAAENSYRELCSQAETFTTSACDLFYTVAGRELNTPTECALSFSHELCEKELVDFSDKPTHVGIASNRQPYNINNLSGEEGNNLYNLNHLQDLRDAAFKESASRLLGVVKSGDTRVYKYLANNGIPEYYEITRTDCEAEEVDYPLGFSVKDKEDPQCRCTEHYRCTDNTVLKINWPSGIKYYFEISGYIVSEDYVRTFFDNGRFNVSTRFPGVEKIFADVIKETDTKIRDTQECQSIGLLK